MKSLNFSINACLGRISQHFSQTRLGQSDRQAATGGERYES